MPLQNFFSASYDIVQMFKKEKYEMFVLDLMNKSKYIFPDSYVAVKEQSNGQCDFLNCKTGSEFDAKLPLEKNQVKMLTDGKKHAPKLEEWICEMCEEASAFQLASRQVGQDYGVAETKLYNIMKEKILRDKKNENIIFFIPFPIVQNFQGCPHLLFASDYLDFIYDSFKKDSALNLKARELFAIYPSGEKNIFVLRNLNEKCLEYIEDESLSRYFTFETVKIND